jgi:hypothetical protein
MRISFFVTSKTPPPDGINSSEETAFPYLLSNSEAILAALGK